GFGTGNYKDSKMETLTNFGNGNYYYIDNILEAKKVLVSEMGGTLFTIAKDVKIQIEFNPAKVKSYRLIGYENRLLANEDFNDDKKDAGELGAGHSVTALYEIVPNGGNSISKEGAQYKYVSTGINPAAYDSKEMAALRFRYKPPSDSVSQLIEKAVLDQTQTLDQASADYRFSAAVAAFGLLLRDSKYKGTASYDQVLDLAKAAKGEDPEGYRAEFLRLVETAKHLSVQ
ncbi:MAG: YfbK domain-containing protein, partial [Bacteroidota bacterium]